MAELSGRATRISGSETAWTRKLDPCDNTSNVLYSESYRVKKRNKFRPVLLEIKAYHFLTFRFHIVSLSIFFYVYFILIHKTPCHLDKLQHCRAMDFLAFHKLLKCADAEYWFGFCPYCLNEWVPQVWCVGDTWLSTWRSYWEQLEKQGSGGGSLYRFRPNIMVYSLFLTSFTACV